MTRRIPRFVAFGALLLTWGCAGKQAPPEAGMTRGGVPDLRGETVMVLPVQEVTGVAGDFDAEIEFALRQRSESVEWVFPEDLEARLRRSPSLQVRIDALGVGMFLSGEVNRIGDPLFRDLLQLSAISGSQLAFIPVQLRYRPPTASGEEGADPADATGGEPDPGTVELVVTLVETAGGRVYWQAVLGVPGEPNDPAVLAALADQLSRALVPAPPGG